MLSFKTLPEMVLQSAKAQSKTLACHQREKGAWKRFDADTFHSQVRHMTLALHKLGIQKGDTVGILASPSFHWLVADLAIQSAGGVSVPLYTLASKENVQFKIRDSQMSCCFVVGEETWKILEPFAFSFRQIITLDVPRGLSTRKDWNAVLTLGEGVDRAKPWLYETLVDQVEEGDLASILYTSGSTGSPKGVLLTQKNFVSQLQGAGQRFPLQGGRDRAVTCLPLAHSFERMIVYYYLACGIDIYFVDDVKQLGDYMPEVKPNVMTVVPRLLEKVFSKIEVKVLEARGIRGKLARWALKQALEQTPESFRHSWRKTVADVLLYRKARRSFGGQLLYLIVGGAATPASLCRFYPNIGLSLYQGYGLTECSPVVCANAPGHNKSGTVGKPFPEVEIKFSEEGELWVRGPNVMQGYHQLPEQTRAVLDSEGWLHTGDRAKADADGFVTITGRLKELFKTSVGEYVAPAPIEQALCDSPWIETAMVVAEGKKFVSALLFPDFEHVRRLKKISGVDASDETFLNATTTQKEIQAHVDRVNQKLSAWEKIKQFRVVCAPLSVVGGELTPTLKLRRHVVGEKYREWIEQMYA